MHLLSEKCSLSCSQLKHADKQVIPNAERHASFMVADLRPPPTCTLSKTIVYSNLQLDQRSWVGARDGHQKAWQDAFDSLVVLVIV